MPNSSVGCPKTTFSAHMKPTNSRGGRFMAPTDACPPCKIYRSKRDGKACVGASKDLRAGGPVNPLGYHGTNRVMTGRSNRPSSHGYGTRQAGMRPAQSHPTYSARNGSLRGHAPSRPPASPQPRASARNAPRGQAPNLHAENHQRQPQPRRSQPSGGGRREERR
jgi:hypothetical protein